MEALTDISVDNTAVHQASGKHLLLTMKDCQNSILNNLPVLERLVEAAATATGATILQLCSQKFSPQGVTIIAVLAESHASLHTYPESNAVFWDCFTCGDTCKPELSIPVLTNMLNPESYDQEIIRRGID